MKTPRFDVVELRDTIKTMGFLPMDRIVVRPWRAGPQGNEKFVVVEGNRRVTALKWLIQLGDEGKETFSKEQNKNFTELEVLLLDDLNADPSARLVIPGLRHVSGIKEWGAYQKARTVYILREGGKSQQDVAQSLGLSVIEANRLTPVIYAYWTTSDFHHEARKYAKAMGMWYLNGVGVTQLALRAGVNVD
jgi:hypothetical protein